MSKIISHERLVIRFQIVCAVLPGPCFSPSVGMMFRIRPLRKKREVRACGKALLDVWDGADEWSRFFSMRLFSEFMHRNWSRVLLMWRSCADDRRRRRRWWPVKLSDDDDVRQHKNFTTESGGVVVMLRSEGFFGMMRSALVPRLRVEFGGEKECEMMGITKQRTNFDQQLIGECSKFFGTCKMLESAILLCYTSQ